MQYGSLNLDGTWTGIVDELIHKNADIGILIHTVFKCIPATSICSYAFSAVSDLFITMLRSAAIQFSKPVSQGHNRLFIKNPTGYFNIKAYFEPIRDLAWIGIGLFCLMCSFGLFILSK